MKQFDDFSAQTLYCPNCKQANPVRKHLLLVLPNGNIYDYRCAKCGKSLGTQIDTNSGPNPDFH